MRITAAVLMIVGLVLSACASYPSSGVQVPENLRPAESQVLVATLLARGSQNYECRLGDDGAKPQWAFVAPEADLYDSSGRRVGSHYQGPRWQGLDGSKILGTTVSRAESPSPTSIPWLLLSARSEGAKGSFSDVTSVQRLNTVGGTSPPPSECAAAKLGEIRRVAYTAEYVFFKPRQAATY
jgi:hypothetical protein